MIKTFLIALILCITISCGSLSKSKSNEANRLLSAKQLIPVGRFSYDGTGYLHLYSSAAHFSFSFKGTGCYIAADLTAGQHHNYLQYELDGAYQKRILIRYPSKEPIEIKVAKAGDHTITIYKATEAHTGDIIIQSISGEQLHAVTPSTKTMIEFIGNSITCGAASDASEVPCGQGAYHDQHNAYMAYGPRIARALKADYMVSAVSGIGVYRNWNSDGPAMPDVYSRSDLQAEASGQWNFKIYQPAIISIALGTNDFSNGDGKKMRLPFDSALFVNKYIGFVSFICSKYSNSKILLVTSPMVKNDHAKKFERCLTAVKAHFDSLKGERKIFIATYFVHPLEGGGCNGHPDLSEHDSLAQELIPVFHELLRRK